MDYLTEQINDFMMNYSKEVEEISLEYINNYKDKGFTIFGGGNIGSIKDKCFISISKNKNNFEKQNAKIWYFDKCESPNITASIAIKLLENLK